MRVALYARVSTTRQAQAQTIEQQIERLREHGRQQGWEEADTEIFRDDGYSGASLSRPGLDRLRDRAAFGEIDRIVITAPDRLARKFAHQVVLIDEFEQHGCRVEFLDRPMGDDPHDQLMLQIRGAFAEYERMMISERMRRGRLMKYQTGTLLPWTKPPYGYRLDPDRPRDPTQVRIEESEAVVVQTIFADYLEEDHTLYGVAHQLMERGILAPSGMRRWSPATLAAILKNPAYTGTVYLGRTRARPSQGRFSALRPVSAVDNGRIRTPREEWIRIATIPAVVSEETFDRAQTKLAQNQSFARRNNTAHEYLLRAMVSCGHCRLACMGRMVPTGYRYYVCRGHGSAYASCRDEKCASRYIPAEQLDAIVWEDLSALIREPKAIEAALMRAQGGEWLPQELQARRELLRKAGRSLEGQLERLTEGYLSGVIPLEEYRRRRQEIEGRRGSLDEQAKQLEANVNRKAELAGLVTSIEAFRERIERGLEQATFEQKRHLVELLIDRVVVTDGDVEIRYVFPTSRSSESIRFCHLRSDYRDLLRR
jgi:site-specific DNA recombinase